MRIYEGIKSRIGNVITLSKKLIKEEEGVIFDSGPLIGGIYLISVLGTCTYFGLRYKNMEEITKFAERFSKSIDNKVN